MQCDRVLKYICEDHEGNPIYATELMEALGYNTRQILDIIARMISKEHVRINYKVMSSRAIDQYIVSLLPKGRDFYNKSNYKALSEKEYKKEKAESRENWTKSNWWVPMILGGLIGSVISAGITLLITTALTAKEKHQSPRLSKPELRVRADRNENRSR